MKKHKIFHTAPKIECKYCPKKFHRVKLLNEHIKLKHEIETAACQFCGKVLNVMSIHRHVKEHHSGQPRINCPMTGCTGTYLRKYYLIDHIKRMHKDYFNSLTLDEKKALENSLIKKTVD